MAKPLTPAKLKAKIQKAILKEKSYQERTAHAENPQIIEMRIRSQGKLDALECVLWALNGSNCLLNSLAGE